MEEEAEPEDAEDEAVCKGIRVGGRPAAIRASVAAFAAPRPVGTFSDGMVGSCEWGWEWVEEEDEREGVVIVVSVIPCEPEAEPDEDEDEVKDDVMGELDVEATEAARGEWDEDEDEDDAGAPVADAPDIERWFLKWISRPTPPGSDDDDALPADPPIGGFCNAPAPVHAEGGGP